MPIKPRFIQPVRAVRTAVGMTQRQFAKRFDVSESYIQSIELGHRQISEELADEIMIQFGVLSNSLKTKRGKPVAFYEGFDDAPLKKNIERWEHNFSEPTKRSLRCFATT